MYKSIEQIRNLKREKLVILENVYKSNNLDEVCERQRTLGNMTVSIYTDVANALMPIFQEDGVNNIVWSNISMRLEKLSFISMPTASEIREKYKQSVENPTVVEVGGDCPPRPGEKRKAKVELPAFLAILAAQGIAVPLILNIFGVPRWALVLVDVSLMTIEVVAYFAKGKDTVYEAKKGTNESAVNYESMYRKAIREVYADNRNRLNIWFDNLEKITKEEIDKELGKSGGTI